MIFIVLLMALFNRFTFNSSSDKTSRLSMPDPSSNRRKLIEIQKKLIPEAKLEIDKFMKKSDFEKLQHFSKFLK